MRTGLTWQDSSSLSPLGGSSQDQEDSDIIDYLICSVPDLSPSWDLACFFSALKSLRGKELGAVLLTKLGPQTLLTPCSH